MAHREDTTVDLARLRAAVEATRLSYGLTGGDVRALVKAAAAFGARAVCVPPAFVAQAASVGATSLEIATVASFPTGDHPAHALEREVTGAVRDGADHVDLVLPGALIAERRWAELATHVRTVREWAGGAASGRRVALKAILETAAWDGDRVRAAAAAAIEGGAVWLKTSTGFHPAGGATLAAVALLREIAPPNVGVKASGGIRTRAQALAMLDAGADRIGTSSEAVILHEEGAEPG